MDTKNSYCWLNPTRLPIVEIVGLTLVLAFMSLAFGKASNMALSFPHWVGHTLSLPVAQVEIQAPGASELLVP
jgi:hypothetical protein